MAGRRLRVGVLDVESGHLHGTWLQEQLATKWPDLTVALKPMGARARRSGRSSRGTQIPIREFYSEPIYQAVSRGRLDVGLHRMKDLPAPLPDDVELVAVTERLTPLDVLVTGDGAILDELEEKARVGVSSLRRQAQLARYRRDLEIEFIVGSLADRLRMVDVGQLRGVVVAAAGIEWRGWQHRVSEVFTSHVCVPAVGQAALGLLVRKESTEIAEKLKFLNHLLSRREIEAERSFFEAVGAWEGAPVGGLARVKGDILRIEGCVCALDGKKIIRGWAEGFPDDPLRTGERLAATLLDKGAGEILASFASELGVD